MRDEYEKMTALPQLLTHISQTRPNSSAFNYKENNEWKHISTEVFVSHVVKFAQLLQNQGIQKGDAVGILSPSSPFWLMADFAILMNGAVSVPFFINESEEHVRFKVKDANLKGIFVLSDYEQKLNERFTKFIEPLIHSFSFIITKNILFPQSIEFESKGGDQLMKSYVGPHLLEDDSATIIYTSGSTGQPKGVELTHKNFMAQIQSITKLFSDLSPQDNVLSFLPIAHSFERTLIYFYISRGTSIYFCPDITNIAQCLQEVEPTFMATVPRLLEKMHAKIIEKAQAKTWIKKKIAMWALKRALKKPKTFLTDLLVYKKIRTLFGKKLKYLISGGSPLPLDMYRFFVNIGIPLYQGYGLTEACPVITTNFINRHKVGTVGPALPDVEMKISSNGEIFARGNNIMKGYHNLIDETKHAIDSNGWLHTGDTGTIDKDGFLTITGRIKELCKTSGGKYVSPIPLEEKLKKNSLIDMAMIIADGRKFVSALLFIDREKNNGALKNNLNHFIKKVNATLNEWEQIRAWHIIFDTPTVENGELTPTLKLRRKVIIEEYHDIIEEMYTKKDNL